MTRFFTIAFCGLFTALAGLAQTDAPDPIKAKIDAAKSALDVERSSFKSGVISSFEAREAAVRKDGNKKLLDELKWERKQYDEKGLLPRSLPAALRQKMSAAIAKVDAAYDQAVKQYTIAKKDDLATAVEKEHEAFKRQIERFASRLDAFQIDSVWKGTLSTVTVRAGRPIEKRTTFEMQVVERDGKSFKAALSYGDGTEGEGVGTIEKGKLEWKRTVPDRFKKTDTVTDFTGMLKDEKLQFEFVTSGAGPSGRGLLVLDKKK